MSHRKSRLLALAGTAITAGLALLSPAPASGGPLVDTTSACDNGSTSRVFQPYLDPALYFKAPDGSFENGARDWSLADGAAVVDGASANLVGPGSRALELPSGSSVTSPTVCVGLGEPTVRFMVKKLGGGGTATLRTDVLVRDSFGLTDSLTIGVTSGTASFQPTAPQLMVANLLPLVPGQYTPVAFRFVPQGGSWQVDDLYVDPARKP